MREDERGRGAESGGGMRHGERREGGSWGKQRDCASVRMKIYKYMRSIDNWEVEN